MNRTKRLAKLGANSAVLTIAVVVIIVLAYHLSTKHPAQYDFTKSRSNTLTEQTLGLLDNLDRPVEAIGLFKTNSYEESKVRDLLFEMSRRSKKFKFKVVSPNTYPSLTKELGMTEYGVMFKSGQRKKAVSAQELFELPDPVSGKGGAFTGEQAFYNAILAVAINRDVTLCFTEGHGERSLMDDSAAGAANIAKILEDESYIATQLNIQKNKTIPKRCKTIVVAGPAKPFTVLEITDIEQYLKNGGRLLAMLDPFSKSGLERVIEKYGISMDNDIVIDPGGAFGQDAAELRPRLQPGPVTDKLIEQSLTINMLYTRSLELKKAGGVRSATLLESSPDAWAEKSMNGFPKPDGSDRRGPLALAASAEAGKGEKLSRIIVTGDSDFISNMALSAVAQSNESQIIVQRGGTGNIDFFMNSMKWLAGEEKFISIRPQSLDVRPLDIDNELRTLAFYLFTVVIPAILVAIGWFVWHRRRSL